MHVLGTLKGAEVGGRYCCISSATMAGKRKSFGSDSNAKGQKTLKALMRPATSPVCDKMTDWLLCSQMKQIDCNIFICSVIIAAWFQERIHLMWSKLNRGTFEFRFNVPSKPNTPELREYTLIKQIHLIYLP